MSRAAATAAMGAAAASWGVATVTTKVALGQLAPTDLLAIELLSATAIVWTALAVGSGAVWPPARRRFIALGLLQPGLSFVLFDIGLAHTGAADGAILLASEGVIAALLGWAALGERPSALTSCALAVGTGGSALVALQAGGQGAGLAGDVLVLGAAATGALYGVAARRLSPTAAVLAGTGTQLLAATAVAVPLSALAAASGRSHLAHADAAHLLAAVATGATGAALPFLLFNVAIRRVTVVTSALITNLVPVIATGLAVALLGERPAALQLAGGALVLAAAAAAGSGDRAAEAEVPGFVIDRPRSETYGRTRCPT